MTIRLVTVSGPRGAGKETVVKALLDAIPGMHRIVPHTTRGLRPGERDGREYHFVSDLEFRELIGRDAFLWHGDIGPTQRSGTTLSEFHVSSAGSVIDVLPGGARKMKERVRRMGGLVFMLAVFAPPEERRARIRARQGGISEKEVERLMLTDPVSPHPADFFDFDFRIWNAGMSPEKAGQRVVRAVNVFLDNTT